jgi:hypothetical protein
MKILALICGIGLLACNVFAGDWSAPVEVRHEEDIAVSYQARIDGQWLVVRAKVGPGWHTFCMDNKRRADEKLAGKLAISVDKPTEIVPAGIEVEGPWFQTEPKDFSHPELRWFSWGFDKEATFAARLRRPAAGKLAIRGQACTDAICKNIDVIVPVSPSGAAASELEVKKLLPVVDAVRTR